MCASRVTAGIVRMDTLIQVEIQYRRGSRARRSAALPRAIPKHKMEAATVGKKGPATRVKREGTLGRVPSFLPTDPLILCLTFPHLPFAQPPTLVWES